jgi:hypothetical protein
MAAEPDLSGVDDKATTVLPSKTDGLRSPMQFHTKQRTLRQGSHAKLGYDAKNVSIGYVTLCDTVSRLIDYIRLASLYNKWQNTQERIRV